MNVLMTTLLLADRIHNDFFGDVVSVAELRDAWQLGLVWSSIRTRLHRWHALSFIDAPVVATVFAVTVHVAHPQPGFERPDRWSAALIILAVVLATPALIGIYRKHAGTCESRAFQRDLIDVMGVPFYHLYDALSYARELFRGNRVTSVEREQVQRFVALRRMPTVDAPLFGVGRGKNLIIIQAESLHHFVLNMRVCGQAVTPNLNAFAAESLRFPNFFDQTHGGSTSDAIFMALHSLHPLPVGAIATRHLQHRYLGLADILGRHGYRTLAAMGAPGEPWKIGTLLRRLGFDTTYLSDAFQGEHFGQGLADHEFFAQAVPLLEQQSSPFMAFLISLSNHDPFDLPEHHRRLDCGDLEGTHLGNYLHSSHYFDVAFGEFMSTLRTNRLLDESIIVVYGDHEAFLRDPPALGPLVGLRADDALGWWSIRKRVPLLIRLPYGRHAREVHRAGGQLDISPTALSLLGISCCDTVMIGHDLSSDTASLVVIRDGSCTDGRYACVSAVSTRAGWTVENLASPAGRDKRAPRPARRCFDRGREIACDTLKGMYAAALEELRVSDLILAGDLVPDLRSDLTRRNRGARESGHPCSG